MAQDINAKADAPSKRTLPKGAAQEAEVYGALGALLGVLEVIATDEATPISPAQLTRIRSAFGIAQRLQQYVEALLTLAADDLEQRLRRAHCRTRPLVEHALRGALRAFEAYDVELRWPEHASWGDQTVFIDSSRVDRALSALVAALASCLGKGGAIEVEVTTVDSCAVLYLRGERGSELPRGPSPFESGLLERAFRRLLELQGGAFAVDFEQLRFEVALPLADEP
jgi:hypothetical protein